MSLEQNDFDTSPATPVDGFLKSFKSHPASVGESYFGHLLFALRFSFRLFGAGFAALIHAFIPAFFETTASREVIAIRDELVNRHQPQDNG